MPRVMHFELAADDTDRASRFYGDVFGWTFQKWDGPMDYWMIETGGEGDTCPGINGGLSKATAQFPAGAPVNTIGVASVDESVARITDAGGSVVMPKMAVPGVGWLAYAKDTEGNTFGVMQPDPNAA